MEADKVMSLSDLQEKLGLKGPFGRMLAKLAFKTLKLGELNRLQNKYKDISGAEFAARILDEVDVSYRIPAGQLEQIPKDGGFILVCNHHYGSIDGLILEATVGALRPDLKMLTTFMLTLIPGLRDCFIPVDNFSTGASRSVSGIRSAIEHMQGGHPLGLFPAGEVATWQKKKDRTALKRLIEDKPWADNVVKLVKNSGLPVIPVYFEGCNSRLFHLLGLIHPRLRTVRLVHEMFNKRGRTVEVRFGQPVTTAEIEGMDIPTFGKYLRNRCYALEANCQPVKDSAERIWPVPLAESVDPELVSREMAALDDEILFESGDYRVYLIRTRQAPNAMRELYRLREETFRGVGEGTGRPEDTDIYDDRYYQLILWNTKDERIAGAYRIGDCGDVMSKHGVDGIYTASLFKYKEEAIPILERCIELGRSFVAPAYQRDVLPLKMLLAGLTVSSLKIPDAHYFTGPVSISNDLPDFYKSLVVYFLERDSAYLESDRIVEPPHPFTPDYLSVNPDDLLGQVPEGDMDRLDRLISTLSDGKYRIPVLVRKYFNCSARLLCFNVDPDFMDSLDALILLRMSDFPPKMLRSILRCVPDDLKEQALIHFYGTKDI